MSISPTFKLEFFIQKCFFQVRLCIVIFWQKNIGTKGERIMLMKLTVDSWDLDNFNLVKVRTNYCPSCLKKYYIISPLSFQIPNIQFNSQPYNLNTVRFQAGL